MSSFTVGGLSTGVNYQDLISKLIELERQPIKILEGKKSNYNARISTYTELSSKLSDLKNAANKLKSSSNFYVKSVTVNDDAVLSANASSIASDGNYTVSVTSLASEEKEVHNGTGLTAETDVVNSSGGDSIFQYTYAGTQTSITVADGTTLAGLRELINDDDNNPGVSATIVNDGTNYRLILTGDDTGATKTITIDAGTTLSGFSSADFSDADKQAADAVFSVDGLAITRESNSITDVIAGLTLNLLTEGSSTTVSVTSDKDAIKDQITEFVTAYNNVTSLISTNSKYNDTDKTVGPFTGERTTRAIQESLRNIVSRSVSGLSGDISLLAEMGITTDYETGKLKIDSSALDTKLGTNLDDIAEIFGDASNGVATGLYEYITTVRSSVDGAITMREKGLKDIIANIDKSIKNMEYRIDKTEANLTRKFTALESLVSGMNTTGSYLSSFSTII
ncbi:MAG: flagellar filament capping protein FliD [Nitrospiraceae bacterium]|nr:MAG: flagellar filament capping protein FliD [Nitrospiraceae bacterium]